MLFGIFWKKLIRESFNQTPDVLISTSTYPEARVVHYQIRKSNFREAIRKWNLVTSNPSNKGGGRKKWVIGSHY